MKISPQIVLATILTAGSLAAIHGRAAESMATPPAGLVNYVTGEVWINGTRADALSAGRAVLEKDLEIVTRDGMAELLLTPGSFLRLGRGSTLTLESSAAPDVRLRLIKGRAVVEVLAPQPPIHFEENGVSAVFMKPGLYSFEITRGRIAVYRGEAIIRKGSRQLEAAAGIAVKTRGFREVPATLDSADPIVAWSNLRSEQLSSQSAAAAQTGGPRPGWEWDPWTHSYTWLSASGTVTGPFGWPYYSPGYAPNAIPVHSGDGYLYGPPVIRPSDIAQPATPGRTRPPSGVPLTAPGVPQFPNNRF